MMGDQDIQERLSAVEVPPTALRIDALVAGGRKRVLRRRAVQAGCGVAVAAALLVAVPSLLPTGERRTEQVATVPEPSAASGPRQAKADPRLPTVRCDATRLPVPAGMTAVQPAGVDPGGRYVIGNDSHTSDASTPDGKVAGVGDSQPILWTNGQPQVLPKLGDWVSATAVNASGVVVAVAGAKDKWADSVVRYTAGVPAKLQPPAGTWRFELAKINAAGDVLVNATRPGKADSRVDAVLLWKAGSTTAVKLPLPAGAEGYGLTDNGTIVGVVSSGPDTADLRSYAWDQHGKGRALPGPAGQTSAVSDVAGAWATGNLWPSGAVARWDITTGKVSELPVDSPANGVNAKGWIASNGTVLRTDANVELRAANGVKGDALDVSDNGLVIGLPMDGASGVITWACGH